MLTPHGKAWRNLAHPNLARKKKTNKELYVLKIRALHALQLNMPELIELMHVADHLGHRKGCRVGGGKGGGRGVQGGKVGGGAGCEHRR